MIHTAAGFSALATAKPIVPTLVCVAAVGLVALGPGWARPLSQAESGLLATLGASIIPRSRTEPVQWNEDERLAYLQQVNTEHRKVYEAIARRDAEAARNAMRQHLVNSRERRRQLFGASGPGAAS